MNLNKRFNPDKTSAAIKKFSYLSLSRGLGSAPKRGLSKSLDLRLQLPLAEMNDGYFHLRERFINRLMKDGKKSVATKLFDESLEMFYETVQQTDEENLAKQIKSRKKSKDD